MKELAVGQVRDDNVSIYLILERSAFFDNDHFMRNKCLVLYTRQQSYKTGEIHVWSDEACRFDALLGETS